MIGRHPTSLSPASLRLLACWGADALDVPFPNKNDKNDANGESVWTYHAMANDHRLKKKNRISFFEGLILTFLYESFFFYLINQFGRKMQG